MSAPVSEEYLVLLKTFIEMCTKDPSHLHNPSLKFFKDYLISLGATIPSAESTDEASSNTFTSEKMEEDEVAGESGKISSSEESDESEVELDTTGVIEAESDEPLPMGDENIEVTEEMLTESSDKRVEAMHLLIEGNKEEAIKCLTDSILANPQGAIGYAKRASILLSMNKPNAVIRDCNKALALNPDQALAYKYRGRAHRLLGNWEAAAKDLSLACKLDYTEEANEWLKEVTPNAKKLQEHDRKYERKRLEKMHRHRKSKTKTESGKRTRPEDILPPNIAECLSDEDFVRLLKDPEIAALSSGINSSDGINRFCSHPKVAEVMAKVRAKMDAKKSDKHQTDEEETF